MLELHLKCQSTVKPRISCLLKIVLEVEYFLTSSGPPSILLNRIDQRHHSRLVIAIFLIVIHDVEPILIFLPSVRDAKEKPLVVLIFLKVTTNVQVVFELVCLEYVLKVTRFKSTFKD